MSIIKHVTLQKIVAHDFRYDPRNLLRSVKEFLSFVFYAYLSSFGEKIFCIYILQSDDLFTSFVKASAGKFLSFYVCKLK